jgi:hypothetical protein
MALTILQPGASLIVRGLKPAERRPRSYFLNGTGPQPGTRIAIHAGQRRVRLPDVEHLLSRTAGDARPFLASLVAALRQDPARATATARLAPTNAVLGTAVIGLPVRVGVMWEWPFTDVEAFAEPVAASGRAGFWEWQP